MTFPRREEVLEAFEEAARLNRRPLVGLIYYDDLHTDGKLASKLAERWQKRRIDEELRAKRPRFPQWEAPVVAGMRHCFECRKTQPVEAFRWEGRLVVTCETCRARVKLQKASPLIATHAAWGSTCFHGYATGRTACGSRLRADVAIVELHAVPAAAPTCRRGGCRFVAWPQMPPTIDARPTL